VEDLTVSMRGLAAKHSVTCTVLQSTASAPGMWQPPLYALSIALRTTLFGTSAYVA